MQMSCYINLKYHRVLQVIILGKNGSTGLEIPALEGNRI